MILKIIRGIARVARLLVAGHTAVPPKEIRIRHLRASRKLRLCHTRGSMPGRFAYSLMCASLKRLRNHTLRLLCDLCLGYH